MLSNRGGRTVVATVLVAIMGSGCTSDGSGEGDGPTVPLPPVSYPAAEVPKDRPADAVAAAMLRIDPCRLLDPAVADVAAFPVGSTRERYRPHSCEVENERFDEVSVVLGVQYDAAERFHDELTTLGGAKAYVDDAQSDFCRVRLPVSFTHVIEFIGQATIAGRERGCASAKGFAASAAELLQRPQGARTSLPLTDRTACDVLTEAMGSAVGTQRELVYGFDFLAGVDRCDLMPKPPSTPGAIGLVPVTGDVTLQFEYAPDPWQDEKHRFGVIEGTRVRLYRSVSCMYSWSQGRAFVDDSGQEHQVVTMHGLPCKEGARLVPKVIRALENQPPPSPRAQRPVLYEPDVPDVAAAGACVYLAPDQSPCRPYVQVDVPDDDLARKVAADPNLACRLAGDIVRKRFGDTLQPVTAGMPLPGGGEQGACVFVEPTHALQVWLAVRIRGVLYETNATIDGRGASVESENYPGYGNRVIEVRLSDDVLLRGEVRVRPVRTAGTVNTAPVDRRPLALLAPTLEDVLATYF